MPRVVKETRTLEQSDEVAPVRESSQEPGSITAAKVIYIIATVIIVLLAFRFFLALFGANQSNPFAQLIYNLSYPFAVPFYGLFNYKTQYGIAAFEIELLVAMAVYAFVAWLIIQLIGVASRREVVK
jgi:uncharacterized protein YggT (Ycf19 family)